MNLWDAYKEIKVEIDQTEKQISNMQSYEHKAFVEGKLCGLYTASAILAEIDAKNWKSLVDKYSLSKKHSKE